MDTQQADTPSNDDDPLDPRRLDRLRELLSGRRALLVANRSETMIERRLENLLGITLAWVDCEKNGSLKSAQKRVKSGRCELVMVATSFVGHNVDNRLKQSCKRMNVPFVDVKKGKFHGCVRALASALLPS